MVCLCGQLWHNHGQPTVLLLHVIKLTHALQHKKDANNSIPEDTRMLVQSHAVLVSATHLWQLCLCAPLTSGTDPDYSFVSSSQSFEVLPNHTNTMLCPIVLPHNPITTLPLLVLPSHPITTLPFLVLKSHPILTLPPLVQKSHSITTSFSTGSKIPPFYYTPLTGSFTAIFPTLSLDLEQW